MAIDIMAFKQAHGRYTAGPNLSVVNRPDLPAKPNGIPMVLHMAPAYAGGLSATVTFALVLHFGPVPSILCGSPGGLD